MPLKDREARNAFHREYRVKTKLYCVTMLLDPRKDGDLMEWVKAISNKNAYLKALVRADMQTHEGRIGDVYLS